MKRKAFLPPIPPRNCLPLLAVLALVCACPRSQAVPAELLFEDDFDQGIPGWTSVLPSGALSWNNGPLLWQYDIETTWIWENSNIYSDNATYSPSRRAAMLINDTVTSASNYTFTVRIRAADDDACGLIWGYQDENNFYRVSFTRQAGRLGWPFSGWNVDRMANGEFSDLFGRGNTNLAYTDFLYGANRFFDVIVGMTNGLFSLTVVDDPTNDFPVIYNLVTSSPLPAAVPGKVGLFTWGQSATVGDGLPSVGVRFHSVLLEPTPLTGTTNPLAPTWTTLITPRGDGTADVGASPPIWALMMDANGSTSRLRETSGRFAGGDNVAAGSTNFCAATIVAGDAENWSNYVFSARCIPADDDGWGLMVRYQNPSNWYRIAFRRQNSASGCKGGLSIQKCVDGVFDQIMYDANAFPRTFPTVNTPADVHVAAIDNQFQVLVVANPTSASPTFYSYGPFTDSSLTKGKIGLFSWAQLYQEYDYARVEKIAGQGLLVASAFGSPDPPVGLNDLTPGSSVTASVATPVYDAPGVRRVLTGWQGGGSVPASGTTNSVTFTLSSLSLINWTWRTEYQLSVAASGEGQVTTSAGPWVEAGVAVTVTAQPNPGHIFLGWSGASASTVATQVFAMAGPRSLTAHFAADADADGLADNWELQYFGSLAQDGAGNPDGDDASNLAEFQRGTNPNFAEPLVVSDGLGSQWVNTGRDGFGGGGAPLAGQVYVVNLGPGYRGAWDTSNDYRYGNDSTFVPANNLSTNYDSFQTPIVVVRPEVWTNEAWGTNFSATWELSVGDNDGSCFYFRYNNESNWYRVTLCGEVEGASTWRPRLGVSVQGRINGLFTNIPLTELAGPGFAFSADPFDGTLNPPLANTPAGFKKSRITVSATNESFEVRVMGWDYFTSAFNPAWEWVYSFTDTSLVNGRIGFGMWGQGTFSTEYADLSLNGIPVPTGGFVDNIVVKSPADGPTVFSEDWETAPLLTEFPAGWVNPWQTNDIQAGEWYVTAHGTIAQQSNSGGATPGTALAPSGGTDCPILLAPPPPTNNYYLKIGFHPFDNDGIGFVYDFQDTNNYSLVLFRQEATYAGAVPPGLSVSRKSAGVWTDIVAGDPGFLYTPGTPFEIEFANNNGSYRLLARDLDDPSKTGQWTWTSAPAAVGNRFGLATWAETDAHFLYARAYALATVEPFAPFAITNISLAGGNVVLNISKPASWNYDVLSAATVLGPWTTNAVNQSAAQYSEPAPGSGRFYRLQKSP